MAELITAADVRARVAQAGLRRLVLRPGERITPGALDTAAELGVLVVYPADGRDEASEYPAEDRCLPPLKVVHRSEVDLQPFGGGLAQPGTDVRLQDVIGSADKAPFAVGYMSLERGSFPWHLDYDEVDVILEGELVIRRGLESACAGAGDIIFIPKGSQIRFETPSRVRFVYVTYPADWAK